MKSFIQSVAGTSSYFKRAIEKQQMRDLIRTRGGTAKPQSPRDVFVQPASRSVLLTWKLPEDHDNVAGYRIYKNTESNLVAEIRDKGTRQALIPLDSGASPQPANFFVCSISTLGRESSKVMVQGKATAEASAPNVPEPPPGYLAEGAGGKNRTLVNFRGKQMYIR